MPLRLLPESRRRIAACAVLAAIGMASAALNGAPPIPGARFDDSVAGIFKARCVRCHGADDVAGGLRLDSYEEIMRGGERGPAVVPRNGKASLLLQKVMRRDRPPMPPKQALPATEVRAIRTWIEAGALP